MTDNTQALVSAVIVTCRRPVDILERAVRSVLAQTHPHMELLVVNDAPEEKELEASVRAMLESFHDERITYLVHEKNAGACKARNTGIHASHGSFVALLDDDDEWLPEKTTRQLTGFTSPEVGLVYSQYYDVENGQKRLYVSGRKSGDLLPDLLWKNCVGGCSMPMMRREVFDTCGYFDERFRSAQDYDMWIRIARHYQMVCVDEPLILRHVQSVCITGNNAAKKQGFDLFMEKYADLYVGHNDALNYRYMDRTKTWLARGCFKDAAETWKKALKAKAFSKYNVLFPAKGLAKYVLKGRRKTHGS
ncbi:MAG: glycosyltransferase [Lachnospiraceae bacterium]|nr:glycosyltransferase [Lachnospiraceae bacterium]